MKIPNIKLVSFATCPYVQRALIVLKEKSIPHELEYIDLEAPPEWFYDVSPLEKVPVLLADNKAVFESLVICEYLDEISPNSLHPNDPYEKAYNRAWMEFGDEILTTTYSYFNSEDSTQFKQLRATLLDRFDILEDEINNKPFFNSETFTLVDAVYGPLFRIHALLQQNYQTNLLDETPKLQQWQDVLLAHPSVMNSAPDNYPEQMRAYFKRQNSILNKSVVKK